jgi:flagellar biosynthesis/type III secretory pathway M-ring protein FliF/YscJ
MPFIIRQPQQYWVLAACLILVAVLYKADYQKRGSNPYYQSPPNAQTQTEMQRQAIENSVSGAIGIDNQRGDAVFVVVRQ